MLTEADSTVKKLNQLLGFILRISIKLKGPHSVITFV